MCVIADRRGHDAAAYLRVARHSRAARCAAAICPPLNSMAESFFATLECELLDRTTLSTYSEARAAVFAFIEEWYNTRRRHSALGYRSPLEFERLHAGPVDGVRPVDTLQVPTSPLDAALEAGSGLRSAKTSSGHATSAAYRPRHSSTHDVRPCNIHLQPSP